VEIIADDEEEDVDVENAEAGDAAINIASKPLINKETENLVNNPVYRAWLVRSRGVVGVLKMLEKFNQFGD